MYRRCLCSSRMHRLQHEITYHNMTHDNILDYTTLIMYFLSLSLYICIYIYIYREREISRRCLRSSRMRRSQHGSGASCTSSGCRTQSKQIMMIMIILIKPYINDTSNTNDDMFCFLLWRHPDAGHMHTHAYACMHACIRIYISLSIYIYIYTYIERERDVHTYAYIYIYIYT